MFDVAAFDVKKYDEILSRGLSKGVGSREGSMCIEAAICTVLGLPHGDDPQCVTNSVRSFKTALNDKTQWASEESRAAGLRDLGLAQLGSKGVVNDLDFTRLLAKKTIQVLIPALFRDALKHSPKWLEAADKCEREGTREAALHAKRCAACAADADAKSGEKYLVMSAGLALEALKELGSPGCALLEKR